MNTVEKARLVAITAHEAVGQKRKYTLEPYWHHPCQVAATLKAVGSSPEVIAAGWLHDVVEDTGVSIEFIEQEFGRFVANIIRGVTNVTTKEMGNRAFRMMLEREHIAQGTPDMKTVKLADLIDNTRSIAQHDPKFAMVYMAEKEALLSVLKEGNPILFSEAQRIVDEFYERAAAQ